jgi:hypothetical protein
MAQPRPWLHAEFADQHLAGLMIGGQGLSPAAVAIQGEHQHFVPPFAERVGGREFAELSDDVAVPAEMQVRVDAVFLRLRMHLHEAGLLPQPQDIGGNVGEWFAAP